MRLALEISSSLVIVLAVAASAGCGGSEVNQKTRKRSQHLYDTAIVAWDEGKGDTMLAIRNLVRAVEANPDNDEAHYFLGVLLRGQGDLDKAERHLRETVRIRKESDSEDRANVAIAQNALGAVLVDQKRYEEAQVQLEESLDEILNPSPWLPRSNLGLLYIETGKYTLAIDQLRRAVFEQPMFCEGLFRLGRAHYLNKGYEEAEKVLKKALGVADNACHPQYQEIHNLLGMTYLRLGRDDEARKAFDECQRLGDSTPVGGLCREALTGL
jgi:Tfp pilus assembly protein PilF